MSKPTLESLDKRLKSLEKLVADAFQLNKEGVDKKATVEINDETGMAEVKEK